MRPLLLKGHTRPLTTVKYNREGDLLFTAAKDSNPTVWYASNGERLGTYKGHNGAVYDLDVNFNSTRLLTGGADQCAKIWDVESGRQLSNIPHPAMVRSVGFAHGDRMILTVQDSSFSQQPSIFIYNLAEDSKEQETTPVRVMFNKEDDHKKISTALWGELNKTIVTACEDGSIRVWDVETGAQISKVQAHSRPIQRMQFSKDRSMLITASTDQSAKLFDTKTLQLKKTFSSNRPINAAAISPIKNHVIIGGGQEAMAVTTTGAQSGKFEIEWYHMVYETHLDSVKGHFGPVNTLAFSPDGKSFCSGAEDGYIRLHHLDADYEQTKNY